jgi:hypothetical protein
MNPLRFIRRRRRGLVTQLLAMLGVVWLNMVLQPCLMAAEMDADMDMTGPCPHCPAPMTDDCDGAASNGCTYVDSVDYDGRSPHSKLAKKVDHGFGAIAAFPAPCSHPASRWATGPPRDADPHLPAPPINVLYCVYLN